MAAVKKPRGRVWENRETMLLLQKWGGRKYTNKTIVLYKKEAYMARNQRISTGSGLRGQGRRRL